MRIYQHTLTIKNKRMESDTLHSKNILKSRMLKNIFLQLQSDDRLQNKSLIEILWDEVYDSSSKKTKIILTAKITD